MPQTLEKILKEFFSLLRYQWLRKLLSSITEGTCILQLAVSYQKRPSSPSARQRVRGGHAALHGQGCPQGGLSAPQLPVGTRSCTVRGASQTAGRSLLGLFQLIACTVLTAEDLPGLYKVQSDLRHPSLVLLSPVLRGLITRSERPDMVSRA